MSRHAAIEVLANGAVQLVDIDGFQSLPQPVNLQTQIRYGVLMVALRVLEADLESTNDQVINFMIEAQLCEQPGKLFLKHLFPHELFRAFPEIAGAMIVDVFALLDLGGSLNRRMLAEITDHFVKIGAPAVFGRLNIHIFTGHGEPISPGMFVQQLELGRDRKAFALLLA